MNYTDKRKGLNDKGEKKITFASEGQEAVYIMSVIPNS